MTSEQSARYREEAHELRRAGEFEAAGNLYTRAAFEGLGVNEFTLGNTSRYLRPLLSAATCYRLAGDERTCRYRCQVGALLAEEIGERLLARSTPENAYDNARRGAWFEFVGDFRLLGGLDGADDAYERAKEIYREAGDPETADSEVVHGVLLGYFYDVAAAVGHDTETFNLEVSLRYPFSEWVEYKQAYLPDLLDTLFEQGEWVWEDT
ncbi:hypothetical protein ACFQH6_17540 [Halobacteriaceae archaeon GCM10025711]